MSEGSNVILANLDGMLPELESLYKGIHSNPELSMQETRTAAIERIVNAEAAASGAPKPPEFTPLNRYTLVTNDAAATSRVVEALRGHFVADRLRETRPSTASEDFGSFGSEWHSPSVFWFVGGIDADRYAQAKASGRLAEIPTNHNPRFAPVLHPTLETGVQAMVVAAEAWLGR